MHKTHLDAVLEDVCSHEEVSEHMLLCRETLEDSFKQVQRDLQMAVRRCLCLGSVVINTCAVLPAMHIGIARLCLISGRVKLQL